MLFAYKYVPHRMEKMQAYIEFIFYQVWCKAKYKNYDIDLLFAANDDLRLLIIELHTSDVKGANFFLTGLQQVFEDFKDLSDAELVKIKGWFYSNNCIELACSGDMSVTPATYQDISTLSEDLSKHLKDFFKNLYSQSFLSLKSVSSRIGEIDDHYRVFMETNIEGKCPFCGLNDVKGIYHSKREAYDHFLPKGKYPFNSINFHNLAPACHECNSSYKLTLDPLFDSKHPLFSSTGGRRKAFYPYQTTSYSIRLSIELTTQDWTEIKPADIQLKTQPDNLREEVTTWFEVYGIDERYKAKCCGENDGKYWIMQVMDECQNNNRTPEQILKTLTRQAKSNPFAEVNFLKSPFLDACKQRGLFDL